jgi:archaellum biogenesis ATPase FlaH
MNKTVKGTQLTVAWHVDNLKVSHAQSTVVLDQFIADMMESKFGKETPLNKSRGKVHDYLGMMLDFSKLGEVTVTMIDNIKTKQINDQKFLKSFQKRTFTPRVFFMMPQKICGDQLLHTPQTICSKSLRTQSRSETKRFFMMPQKKWVDQLLHPPQTICSK